MFGKANLLSNSVSPEFSHVFGASDSNPFPGRTKITSKAILTVPL